MPDVRYKADVHAFEDKRKKFWIECECGISSKVYHTEEALRAWWNDRPEKTKAK